MGDDQKTPSTSFCTGYDFFKVVINSETKYLEPPKMNRFNMLNQVPMEIFLILFNKYENLHVKGKLKQCLKVKIKKSLACIIFCEEP